MSQLTVYNFLKKNKKKWFKTKQISKGVKVGSAIPSLNQLYKYGEVRKKDNKVSLTKKEVWRTRGASGYAWRFKD